MSKYLFLLLFLIPYPVLALQPDVCASGFGNSNYNGTWHDTGSTFHSLPLYYDVSNTYSLYGFGDGYYRMATKVIQEGANPDTLQDYYLLTGDPPLGTWTANLGTAPGGDTVACAVSSGGSDNSATSTVSQSQTNLFFGFVVFFTSMLIPMWFFKRKI
jgi:hypothetical protein